MHSQVFDRGASLGGPLAPDDESAPPTGVPSLVDGGEGHEVEFAPV